MDLAFVSISAAIWAAFDDVLAIASRKAAVSWA